MQYTYIYLTISPHCTYIDLLLKYSSTLLENCGPYCTLPFWEYQCKPSTTDTITFFKSLHVVIILFHISWIFFTRFKDDYLYNYSGPSKIKWNIPKLFTHWFHALYNHSFVQAQSPHTQPNWHYCALPDLKWIPISRILTKHSENFFDSEVKDRKKWEVILNFFFQKWKTGIFFLHCKFKKVTYV